MVSEVVNNLLDGEVVVHYNIELARFGKIRLNWPYGINEAEDWLPVCGFGDESTLSRPSGLHSEALPIFEPLMQFFWMWSLNEAFPFLKEISNPVV